MDSLIARIEDPNHFEGGRLNKKEGKKGTRKESPNKKPVNQTNGRNLKHWGNLSRTEKVEKK